MTAGAAPVIELEGVRRTFPGPTEVEVLTGVDLTVRRGEYVSVAGPSGSGKSTLLNILGLLDRPSDGVYKLAGFETKTLSDLERTGLRGAEIGFIFQSFNLLPHRNLVENVELAQLYNRAPRADRKRKATSALERVGLGHRLEFLPVTLSGGERQRVAIARAIAAEPAVLLADEPTGNLDQTTSGQILELFDTLNADGFTVVVITHDPLVSARASRRIRLVDGTVVEDNAS